MAVLGGVDDGDILTQNNLKAETIEGRQVVVLALPSRLLRSGDYFVTLSGATGEGEFEVIERYVFRVVIE